MSENVLAVVAGKELTEAQFEAYLKSVPREQQMYAQNLAPINVVANEKAPKYAGFGALNSV